MHLGSWKSSREAREELVFAPCHSSASFVLSQLPVCASTPRQMYAKLVPFSEMEWIYIDTLDIPSWGSQSEQVIMMSDIHIYTYITNIIVSVKYPVHF